MDYPAETRIERARRLDLLDTWTIVLEMRTFCREVLLFKSQQAVKMYNAFCAHTMGK